MAEAPDNRYVGTDGTDETEEIQLITTTTWCSVVTRAHCTTALAQHQCRLAVQNTCKFSNRADCVLVLVQRISYEASSANRGWSVNRSEEECATRQPWKTDDTYGILLHITRCTYLVLEIKSRPVAKTVLIASNPRKRRKNVVGEEKRPSSQCKNRISGIQRRWPKPWQGRI